MSRRRASCQRARDVLPRVERDWRNLHAEIGAAREANQQFSRILREVEAGAEIVVTRHGQPVARIVPAHPPGERRLTPEQETAHARSMERVRKGWDLGGGRFNRDELYDEILARH